MPFKLSSSLFHFVSLVQNQSPMNSAMEIWQKFIQNYFPPKNESESHSQREPGLKSQRWSALNSADSELILSETAINFSALMFFMFSKAVLFCAIPELSSNDFMIFSELPLFKTEKFSAVSERTSSDSALFSADFLSCEAWGFQRWLSVDLLWISSDIKTCKWEYQIVIT